MICLLPLTCIGYSHSPYYKNMDAPFGAGWLNSFHFPVFTWCQPIHCPHHHFKPSYVITYQAVWEDSHKATH